jgi:ParG
LLFVALTVELPEEALARLRAEAARRGTSVDDVIADLVGRLPRPIAGRRHRLSFVGIGESGRSEPTHVKRGRDELAARKYAEGV